VSWLDQIQVRDLDAGVRFELTCRQCGKVRFLTVAQIMARGDYGHLWLAEVQGRARCRQRGCGGTMRLAMPRRGASQGFVGGIA